MLTYLCLTALRRMLATRGDMAGAVHHSDRGVQYASNAYQQALADADMHRSMSRKGNCWDNAVAESFFGTLKQELVPKKPWTGLNDARKAVSNYIHGYYNPKRRHSHIGHIAPIEFETHHQAATEAVA